MTKRQSTINTEVLQTVSDDDTTHNKPVENVWHLTQTSAEEKLYDLEFLLWRLFYSFSKWQEDCQSCVNNYDVSADEIALMHLVRICDRPKSIYEIARLMNRDDMPNLQYSLKKLLKLNIIKKAKKATKKAVFYEITENGTKITEKYCEIRSQILGKFLINFKDHDWEKISAVVTEYKNMYDEASRRTLYLKNK